MKQLARRRNKETPSCASLCCSVAAAVVQTGYEIVVNWLVGAPRETPSLPCLASGRPLFFSASSSSADQQPPLLCLGSGPVLSWPLARPRSPDPPPSRHILVLLIQHKHHANQPLLLLRLKRLPRCQGCAPLDRSFFVFFHRCERVPSQRNGPSFPLAASATYYTGSAAARPPLAPSIDTAAFRTKPSPCLLSLSNSLRSPSPQPIV